MNWIVLLNGNEVARFTKRWMRDDFLQTVEGNAEDYWDTIEPNVGDADEY